MESKKRLIDANALLQSEIKRCGSIPTIGSGYTNETSFKRILDQAPTVDAVEVVHGEWIMCLDVDDVEYIECPICGGEFYDGDNDTFDKPYNYCPNCGAKMDK